MTAVLLLGDWADRGACVTGHHPGVDWFPSQDRAMEKRAIAICNLCPVRRECLDHAIAIREHHGIWGGHTPHERDKIARQRGTRARLIRHGTDAGYAAHRRSGEAACDACSAAHSLYVQGRKAATQ